MEHNWGLEPNVWALDNGPRGPVLLWSTLNLDKACAVRPGFKEHRRAKLWWNNLLLVRIRTEILQTNRAQFLDQIPTRH